MIVRKSYGLNNGSLGNIGAVGVSATNLKMRVSGM